MFVGAALVATRLQHSSLSIHPRALWRCGPAACATLDSGTSAVH